MKPSPSTNQRRFFRGSECARNTRVALAGYVRSMVKPLWMTAGLMTSSFVAWALDRPDPAQLPDQAVDDRERHQVGHGDRGEDGREGQALHHPADAELGE